MTIQEAIKKAIEGGWKQGWYFSHDSGEEMVFGDTNKESENNPCYYKNINSILLDPEFWKCLGKAIGQWKEEVEKRYNATECSHSMFGEIETQSVHPFIRLPKKEGDPEEDLPEGICEVCGWIIHNGVPEWLYHWHRFIDHLAEGKAAESFFAELK